MQTTAKCFTLAVAAISLMPTLAQTASVVVATGGNTTNVVSGYRIHTFTNSATANNFVVAAGGNVDVLVVAGGGGGGGNTYQSGGGGGGGVVYTASYSVAAGTYNVTVGAGGAGGGAGQRGYNGSNSVFGNLTAYGGGGGGNYYAGGGLNGGCGGGGASQVSMTGGTGSQGGNGGTGQNDGNYTAGGGGGAAPSNGWSGAAGGNGGAGYTSTISGSSVKYAGGGGGSSYFGPQGTGTDGGGNASQSGNAGSGTANTGGGGGGVCWTSGNGGAGGSGIVIVRYQLSPAPAIENLPATNVTTASAWLNGYVASTGAAPITAVAVYWGATDGGDPTSGLWTATNTPAGGPWTDGASATHQATGLTANTFYYYRYYATNSFAAGWASASEHFLAGDVTITNTDPLATRTPFGTPDTGTLTIQRDPSATNDTLTVHYAWSGTAVQNVDYTLSPAGTSVTLQAGAASANITITPVWAYSQGAKTVWLSLLSGSYGIGSPASNNVTIADYAYQPGANVTTNAGDWNNNAIWSLGRRPLAGDQVTVTNAVALSNATDVLGSFTMNGGALTFTNWSTCLIASNVFLNAGAITHGVNSDTASPWAPDARVWIACLNDLTVATGATINADGKGYRGAATISAAGYGPGGGPGATGSARGGGYGGRGGMVEHP